MLIQLDWRIHAVRGPARTKVERDHVRESRQQRHQIGLHPPAVEFHGARIGGMREATGNLVLVKQHLADVVEQVGLTGIKAVTQMLNPSEATGFARVQRRWVGANPVRG